MFPVTVLTKVTYRNFEISNLFFCLKRLKLTLWPVGKCKTPNILEMGRSRAKRSEILDSGGVGWGASLGSICATSGTLAMAKYGNLENRLVSRKPLPVERKQAQFRPPGVEREYMCDFWHFGQ